MDKRKRKRIKRKIREGEKRVNEALLSSLRRHARDKAWMEEEMSKEERELFDAMMGDVGDGLIKKEVGEIKEPRTNRPKSQ